jgi:hypothetical protein
MRLDGYFGRNFLETDAGLVTAWFRKRVRQLRMKWVRQLGIPAGLSTRHRLTRWAAERRRA